MFNRFSGSPLYILEGLNNSSEVLTKHAHIISRMRNVKQAHAPYLNYYVDLQPYRRKFSRDENLANFARKFPLVKI